ncbi:unnamed protein product, partial [Didymodactylos carnosus]
MKLLAPLDTELGLACS